MEQPYDPKDVVNEAMLNDIWRTAFPGDSVPDNVDPKWTRLGFQSKNPRTDIRTGVHSLKSLHYFSTHYPNDLRRMVVESVNYPFAASAISIAFSLVLFFRLNRKLSINQSGNKSCSNQIIKDFIDKIKSNRNEFNEIYSNLLKSVHFEFLTNGNSDIHNYQICLHNSIEKLREKFNNLEK
jgi:hypothetical protein